MYDEGLFWRIELGEPGPREERGHSGLARRWSAETIAIAPAELILDHEPHLPRSRPADARAGRYSTGLTFAPFTTLPR